MKVKTSIWDPFWIIALCLFPGVVYYSVNYHNFYKLLYYLLFFIVFLALGFRNCWSFLEFNIEESGIRISQFGRVLYLLPWEKVQTIGTISTRYGVYVYASILTLDEILKLDMHLHNHYKPDEYSYLGNILNKQYMLNSVILKGNIENFLQEKPILRLTTVQSGHRDKEIIYAMKQYSKRSVLQNGGPGVMVYHFDPWDRSSTS